MSTINVHSVLHTGSGHFSSLVNFLPQLANLKKNAEFCKILYIAHLPATSQKDKAAVCVLRLDKI